MRVPYSQLTDDMIRSSDNVVAVDPETGVIRPAYNLLGIFDVRSRKSGRMLEVEVEERNASLLQELTSRVALIKKAQKEESARELAKRHYEIETGMTHIIRCSGSTDAQIQAMEPIKLLEVNTNTVGTGVLPLGFGAMPSAGIHFPSVIIEVTPGEYAKIQAKELKLPPGWELRVDEFPRPVDALEG